MKVKTVNRTIHPDSHEANNSYRVKIGKKNYYDQLIVNIKHEKLPFKCTYVFEGNGIANFESIHFKAEENEGAIKINWVQTLEFKIVNYNA